MENGFSFMQNYLQIASCLVHGETLNQEESLIFLAACKVVCELSCWYKSTAYRLQSKSEYLAKTSNESRPEGKIFRQDV